MTTPAPQPPSRALQAFRRRLDAFFGDPRAAGYAAALATPTRRTATDRALAAHVGATLTRLDTRPAGPALRLRKRLTMHDGRLVAMTGDASPLGADEDVRIVTTTTTVLDADVMRVETDVLVFERDGGS